MVVSTFSIEFAGYWLEEERGDIPARGGLYCVYICGYNPDSRVLLPSRLIYVGNDDNVRKRIGEHEKRPDWEKHLESGGGGVLCYSYAKVVAASIRERCSAALIYRHKPPENLKHVDSFPYQQTTIRTHGSNMLLVRKFTVIKTGTRTERPLPGDWMAVK